MVPSNRQHRGPVQGTGQTILLVVLLVVLVASSISCSNAAKEMQFKSPSAAPGVVYVAEQVSGLEEWARTPESRAFARIYTRQGDADEGQLMRITRSSVVLGSSGESREIERGSVLFMRVWW